MGGDSHVLVFTCFMTLLLFAAQSSRQVIVASGSLYLGMIRMRDGLLGAHASISGISSRENVME